MPRNSHNQTINEAMKSWQKQLTTAQYNKAVGLVTPKKSTEKSKKSE